MMDIAYRDRVEQAAGPAMSAMPDKTDFLRRSQLS
jgi:hypothetical protein